MSSLLWQTNELFSPASLFNLKQTLSQQALLSPLDSTQNLDNINTSVETLIFNSTIDEIYGGWYIQDDNFFYLDALQNTLFAELLYFSSQVTFNGTAAFYVRPILNNLWQTLYNNNLNLFQFNLAVEQHKAPFVFNDEYLQLRLSPSQYRLLSELAQQPLTAQPNDFILNFKKSLATAAEHSKMHFKEAQIQLEVALSELAKDKPPLNNPLKGTSCSTISSEQIIHNAQMLASLCELFQRSAPCITLDQLTNIAESLIEHTEAHLGNSNFTFSQWLNIYYGLCRFIAIFPHSKAVALVENWQALFHHNQQMQNTNQPAEQSAVQWCWFQAGFIMRLLQHLNLLNKKQSRLIEQQLEIILSSTIQKFPFKIKAEPRSLSAKAQQNITPERYNVFEIKIQA
jgi:hypothetical protein